MPPGETPGSAKKRADEDYWRANKRLIIILLSIWAFVSLGCSVLFIEWLNLVNIGQVPLGFWMGQQGAIYVFILLIVIYVQAMKRLDKQHETRLRAIAEGENG